MNIVNVVVVMFKGVLDDVSVFTKEEDAAKAFQQATSVSWEDYKTRRVANEEAEAILGDHAGSDILEVALQ